eukprot:CAMPEP_0175847152 /NCGR_PEP_ID=MMETSP0107_2-20121207/23190_1 /TAXON_ID=195067 ORGANISM="Goniomonas pacifica, Strain CCMP1869" /NCGR_SAMPLE_ID=MMETSP0107_2 /ASSEMBLY_ACC=CAM_ASM_000203 /LENGTH=462 /DNA_ID=CAMNT_0017161927 /DNA_START=153 /DNA_END=1541 /DNA_ORIENTATION=+
MEVLKERQRLAALEAALAHREQELARREAELQRMKQSLDGTQKKDGDLKRAPESYDELMPQLAKPRQITPRELEIGPAIGTGKFAEVNTAWLRIPCAVKKMRGQLSSENLSNFQREAVIMNACNHANVIKLFGFCNDGQKYYLVQELVTGGNLHDRMHKKKQHLTYQQVVRVGLQVADGMAHLHSRNIVHRDIKPHNFVIDTSTEPAKVKMCDFGLARTKEPGQYVQTDGRLAGTPAYQAPEMLKLQPITEKVDQYSFAILLWEMITCQLPWWGKTFDEMVNCVTRLDERPAIPADCPEPLAAVIRDCWQPSPELRPSFDVVLSRLRVVNEMLKGVPEFRSKVAPSKTASSTPSTKSSTSNMQQQHAQHSQQQHGHGQQHHTPAASSAHGSHSTHHHQHHHIASTPISAPAAYATPSYSVLDGASYTPYGMDYGVAAAPAVYDAAPTQRGFTASGGTAVYYL